MGGFPCQSFSIAGKRKGFEDTRGTLFFQIARILKAKRPRTCVLENVKGLVNHDNGKTFATILSTLSELGYHVEWQVLNSKFFGVPQNRERVFIIGRIGKGSSRKIFPLENCREEIVKQQSEVSIPTVFASQGKISRGMPLIKQLNNPTHSNDRLYASEGISPALNTAQGGNRQPFVLQKHQRIRRLTPIECARLQGFPDDWCASLSDSQAYKCYGNAVTVNVIEAIMGKLHDH